jgi:hypothetical protein
MEKVLRIDEVKEQFNQAVDRIYDYFEQNYDAVPNAVQDALYEALQTVIAEDGKLWGEWLDSQTEVEDPPL